MTCIAIVYILYSMKQKKREKREWKNILLPLTKDQFVKITKSARLIGLTRTGFLRSVIEKYYEK